MIAVPNGELTATQLFKQGSLVQFRPALEGRPVVVPSNHDGCVIARSDEAKALGVAMGDPYHLTREQLTRHGVAVFSSNYESDPPQNDGGGRTPGPRAERPTLPAPGAGDPAAPRSHSVPLVRTGSNRTPSDQRGAGAVRGPGRGGAPASKPDGGAGRGLRHDEPVFSNAAVLRQQRDGEVALPYRFHAGPSGGGRAGLERLYRPWCPYQKCGVMLLDLSPATQVQADLFDPRDRARQERLVRALDLLNTDRGARTVRVGNVGGKRPAWAMRQMFRSPRYTTNWQGLPVVRY